jgi:hypothetical protein
MNYVSGFMIVLIAISAISGFMALVTMHNERIEFMAECEKFHSKYECVALWRGAK